MSRSRHPRKNARKASNHRRNAKEWKGDSKWKPKERSYRTADNERRSKRKRSGDVGAQPAKKLLTRISDKAPPCGFCQTFMHRTHEHLPRQKKKR